MVSCTCLVPTAAIDRVPTVKVYLCVLHVYIHMYYVWVVRVCCMHVCMCVCVCTYSCVLHANVCVCVLHAWIRLIVYLCVCTCVTCICVDVLYMVYVMVE